MWRVGFFIYFHFSASPSLVVKESDLIEAIQNNINCAKIEVSDISDGCGSNFMIDVVSDDFQGKRTVMRQQSSAIFTFSGFTTGYT